MGFGAPSKIWESGVLTAGNLGYYANFKVSSFDFTISGCEFGLLGSRLELEPHCLGFSFSGLGFRV